MSSGTEILTLGRYFCTLTSTMFCTNTQLSRSNLRWPPLTTPRMPPRSASCTLRTSPRILSTSLALMSLPSPSVSLGSAPGLAVKRRVERVATENLLERPLELVRQQLKQLLLDPAQYLAELEAHLPVHPGEPRAELLADNLGEPAAAFPPAAGLIPILITETPGRPLAG